MPRYQDYPDIFAHRQRSVLPPELQTDIVRLLAAIHSGDDVHAYLSSYISGIRALPASSVVRVARDIRTRRGWSYVEEGFLSPFRLSKAVWKHPSLNYLFIFSGNGWVREAALGSLNDPPDSPFQFAAIAYRLNDWVGQVRSAAHGCASRLFPTTSAGVVAEASLFLFSQIQQFRRWSELERDLLEATFYRRDVMQAFAELLAQRPPGRMGIVFRQALRNPGLDDMLPGLCREAVVPLVRAIALETLIMRRARWFQGYGHEWVDKRFGFRRRVPRFGQRAIEHQLDVEELLAQAATDRAVVVRKVVASGLINLRHDLSSAMNDVGRLLSEDEYPSVRSRAEFYLKNLPNA